MPADRRPSPGEVIRVTRQPHGARELVRDMELRCDNRILLASPTAEEVRVVGEEPDPGHRLHDPLPKARETPTSGLNDQRLVPRLISFVESYCPSGGTTVTLTPTMVCSRYEANSFGVMAGAP